MIERANGILYSLSIADNKHGVFLNREEGAGPHFNYFGEPQHVVNCLNNMIGHIQEIIHEIEVTHNLDPIQRNLDNLYFSFSKNPKDGDRLTDPITFDVYEYQHYKWMKIEQ